MKTDYKKLIQQAKEIDEKATPGPWMWDMNENNQRRKITDHHKKRALIQRSFLCECASSSYY